MKKLVVMTWMVLGIAFGATATESSALIAEKRANHLSEQMIRELRLNNYQANKIRAINMTVAAQITDIEQQHEGDAQMIETKCKEVLAARDLEFEDVLSTVQYNDYFGDRKMYSKVDKEFMASLNGENAENLALVKKVDDKATASVN